MLDELYEKKLKYNCSYLEIKSKNQSDLLIVFLGCKDFIIVSNFYGIIATGQRVYNFDTMKATYYYKMMNESVRVSRVEKLIKTYEKKRLNIVNIEIKKED